MIARTWALARQTLNRAASVEPAVEAQSTQLAEASPGAQRTPPHRRHLEAPIEERLAIYRPIEAVEPPDTRLATRLAA